MPRVALASDAIVVVREEILDTRFGEVGVALVNGEGRPDGRQRGRVKGGRDVEGLRG